MPLIETLPTETPCTTPVHVPTVATLAPLVLQNTADVAVTLGPPNARRTESPTAMVSTPGVTEYVAARSAETPFGVRREAPCGPTTFDTSDVQAEASRSAAAMVARGATLERMIMAGGFVAQSRCAALGKRLVLHAGAVWDRSRARRETTTAVEEFGGRPRTASCDRG